MNKSSLPTIFVIFGATGDLARRKLVPALFRLHQKKLLPPLFQVVGFSRQELSDEAFGKCVADIAEKIPGASRGELDSFRGLFVYRQGFFDKGDGYARLGEYLGFKDNEWRTCSNKLFHLAVPPEHYRTIFNNLAASHLTDPCSPEEGWTRVIVEKPFGKDLKTAEELDMLLGKLFEEEQIYRIDHYLGKETVQNILSFRFSNSILESSWNRKHVESIAIRMHEDHGVETRGGFYDGVGALRDVGQNHLLQLLALFTMEEPADMGAEAVRAARAKALGSLRIMPLKEIRQYTIRGQYEGYRKEKNVSSSSQTETHFGITAFLRSPRWRGVPIFLESSKKMQKTFAEVVVRFRGPKHGLCAGVGEGGCSNVLRYQIQPDEKVTLSFWVKKPGHDMVAEEHDFVFDYRALYSPDDVVDPHVDPYKKLLLDAIEGSQTLFVSTNEIKASWKFVDPIIRAWRKGAVPLRIYKPGEPVESAF